MAKKKVTKRRLGGAKPKRANGKKKKHQGSYVREAGVEMASAAAGAGTVLGAISTAGIGGFSAAGITSGLATLGAGSMLGGVLIVPALGYGAYRLTKWAFTPANNGGR